MRMRALRYALILVMLTVTSCKDVLDMAPDGKLTMDEIFADNDKTGAFLNICYANIPVKGTRYFFWSRGPVNWSDESWDTDAEAESWIMSGRMYNGDAYAGNHPITNISADAGNGEYWARYWSAIRNCTLFISRIDKATVRNPADRAPLADLSVHPAVLRVGKGRAL